MIARIVLAFVVIGVVLLPGTSRAQEAEQLTLAVVVVVTSAPLFGEDASPSPDADQRLRSTADVLQELRAPEFAGMPFAFAVSPVFCDEVASLGTDTAQELTTLLQDLASRSEVLSAPYAEVRLPDLSGEAEIGRQVTEGRRALSACVEQAPSSVLFPPGLSLGGDVLDALGQVGVEAALGPTDRVGAASVRTRDIALVPSAFIDAGEAPNDAVVQFGRASSAVALLSSDRADLGRFLTGLANDPRIALGSVADVIGDPPPRPTALRAADPPPLAYLRDIRRAENALARLRSYTLQNNRLAGILRTSLARARGSAEWNGEWSVGRRRAQAVVTTARREEDFIRTSNGSVTFTSRRGSVPLTVSNLASYPVRIRVTLSSAKLEFPEGATKIVTVDPPGDTIVFEAVTRSTGSFPLRVHLTSPDRSILFETSELTVRSAAANVSAVVLTSGGALFLLGWYVRRVRRLRRTRQHA